MDSWTRSAKEIRVRQRKQMTSSGYGELIYPVTAPFKFMKDVIKFTVFLVRRIDSDYPGYMSKVITTKLLELAREYVGNWKAELDQALEKRD